MLPPIRLRGVTKQFRHGGRVVDVLHGVDLDIESGGFDAIMGRSGSGKSTLLHLVGALDRPDSGSVEVVGHALHAMGEADLTRFRRTKIGIVFQQFNLVSTLTARENIELPALLDGTDRRERAARSAELLDMLELTDRADHRPDALSGGEQQRVAVARALAPRPEVILADEPTGNLDSVTSRQIWQLLRDLAVVHGLTVLMVTHEPAAAAFARRVHLLRDGRFHDAFDVEGRDAAELATRAEQPDA